MSAIDDLFTYHPPNERTLPKFKEIREAVDNALDALRAAMDPHTLLRAGHPDYSPGSIQASFNSINTTCRDLYQTIAGLAPPSADTTTALRAIRLVRMRLNEHLVAGTPQHVAIADVEGLLRDARMWANAAIAIHDAQRGKDKDVDKGLDVDQLAQRIASLPQGPAVVEPEDGDEPAGLDADQTDQALVAISARDRLLVDVINMLRGRT